MKICAHCQQPFMTSDRRQTHCSAGCVHESQRCNRECLACGIRLHSGQNSYCSRTCLEDGKRQGIEARAKITLPELPWEKADG